MHHRLVRPALTTRATVVSGTGVVTHGPNFGGQDYLSLTAYPAVLDAAHQALRDYGPLTVGSPALGGATPVSKALEAGLRMADTSILAGGPLARPGGHGRTRW